jgi:hypothetical protein
MVNDAKGLATSLKASASYFLLMKLHVEPLSVAGLGFAGIVYLSFPSGLRTSLLRNVSSFNVSSELNSKVYKCNFGP